MFCRKRAYSIKKYGDMYKFTVYSISSRNSNLIPSEWVEELPWPGCYEDDCPRDGPVNDEKLANNLSRAKSRIYDLSMSNNWSYFCTFTISPLKYDRYNLHAWYSDFAKWINNYNERKKIKLSYIFIPELHKDGAWHVHGLLSGLPRNYLSFFVPGVHPQYLIDRGYLNWLDYANRFGFCSMAPVRNPEAVSAYIMKYVGKGLDDRKQELGAHLYYASKKLNTAEIMAKGEILGSDVEDFPFAFENDFVSSSFFTKDELLNSELLLQLVGGDIT